jgi:hypothetical protein
VARSLLAAISWWFLVLPITLHAALNILWLGISVCALALLWTTEARRGPVGRYRRFLAVCALCITVFPTVSDTDDLFTFSLMQVPGNPHGGVGSAPPPPEDSREKSTLHLARLLETLDHYQITAIYAVILTLFCVTFSLLPRLAWESRTLLCAAGRAPPTA